ncbi:hypothetical protein KBD20_02990 [Candidatus Saccharibacteria bacterium]|nr:hypothetical protein [Candidatus Saccharibacteria bacterium]
MGAFRDEQTFAMMDSQQHGNEMGRRSKLSSLAHGLRVDPEILDKLDGELDVSSRVARLRVVAEAVGTLLTEAEGALEIIQAGSVSDVAGFIIADQLPPIELDNSYMYVGSKRHYQLELSDDGGVLIKTNVWGGAMQGAYTFDEPFPLATWWVSERLEIRGVEKDDEFCEQVVGEVTTQMNEMRGLSG